eukprot:PhM_4_TR18434/c0_g2_i1/m.28754
MYRIFGSPAAISTHQSALLFRQAGVPFDLHVTNFMLTRVMTWLHGTNGATFCTLSPDKKIVYPSVIDVLKSASSSSANDAKLMMLPSSAVMKEHWEMCAYSAWWLMLLCGAMRWVLGEGSTGMVRHCGYFLLIPVGPIAHGVARSSRDHMRSILKDYGITNDTSLVMEDHFYDLIEALNEHFAHNKFLFGSAPTLADVFLGAPFTSHFIQDEPPKVVLEEQCPNVAAWVNRMMNAPDNLEARTPQDRGDKFHDKTLNAILDLVHSVLPHLAAQCETFHACVVSNPDNKSGAVELGRIVPQTWNMKLADNISATANLSMGHIHAAKFFSEQVDWSRYPQSARGDDALHRVWAATKDCSITCRTVGVEELYTVTSTPQQQS